LQLPLPTTSKPIHQQTPMTATHAFKAILPTDYLSPTATHAVSRPI